LKRPLRSDKRDGFQDKGGQCAPYGGIETHRAMLLLILLSLGLKSLIFAPIGWWPFSFVCLVPWLIMIGKATRAPRVYFYSFVFALAFFLVNMRWLYPATGAGYVALSVYQSAFFPLVACPLRHVVRRRRLPLGVVLPFVWVGSELLRAVVLSGFPWFFLSHSFHKVLTLIQVSDLVGAYGVSFVVAAVNGAVADAILAYIARRRAVEEKLQRQQAWFSAVFAVVLIGATVVYGQIQLHRDTISAGPRIALIQGDFVNSVDPDTLRDHDALSDVEKMQIYFSMMDAAAKQQPDLYLLPESPWVMYLNPERRDFGLSGRSFRALGKHAREHNAYIVTGSGSAEFTPYDPHQKVRQYNSATVFNPDGSEPGRYDKVHLVIFGEFVPFRFGRLRFLYFWLNRVTPFSGPDGESEFSFFKGDEFRVFRMQAASQGGTGYRFGIPICYEDAMPYISREFVSGGFDGKRADFLLNISNDGWFGRGIQQPQHLAVCVLRAVENRVGIARAVNTGVSAFIEPSGRVHDVVTHDPSTAWPGNCGFAVATVGVDTRYSVYSRSGDWFAWGCALMWLIFFVDYWVVRALTGKYEEAPGASV